MNESKNLLLKLFVLLTVAVGGINSAWAEFVNIAPSPQPNSARFVAGTNWYTIQFNGNDEKHQTGTTSIGSFMNADVVDASGLMLWGSTDGSTDAALWCFVQQSDGKYLIYNKKKGPSYVLGIQNPTSDGNQNIIFYDASTAPAANTHFESVANTGKAGNNTLRVNTTVGINNANGFVKSFKHPSNAAAGANFALALTLRETVPNGYLVTINGDSGEEYTVTTTAGVSSGVNLAKNGQYLDLANAVNAQDLSRISINAPTTKFVWGPVVDNDVKTITYTIKDMVTSAANLTTGFYQLQLFDDNNQKVTNVNNRINGSADNINTKASTIYVMPYKDVPTGGDQNLAKYSGVPSYAGEASTFFYIEKNDNNIQVQSVNGHYATNDGNKTRPVASRTKSEVSGGYDFTNGHLRFTGWVIQGLWGTSGCTGNEGPRVAYNGGINYEQYNAAKVDLSQYSVYKVQMDNITNASDIANDPSVSIKANTPAAANNCGLSKVYQNGYFFFTPGYEPTLADFTVSGVSYSEMTMEIEGSGDIRTLHFKENSAIPDPYVLQTSPAPTADGWAEGTQWYTIHNNRSSKGYLSTQDAGSYLDAQGTLTIQNGTDARNNRGGLWAFIEQEGGGFNIYNNAYGPDFILGVTGSAGNTRLRMYHKDQVPTSVSTLFTHGENNNRDGGASHAYYFQIGLTGDNHLNQQGNYAGTWNNASKDSDQGSAFTVTAIADSHIDALTQYDVYHVSWIGAAVNGMTIDYADGAKTFGRRSSANDGDYLIVEKGSPIDVSNFAVTGSKDYRLAKTASSTVAGHACKALALTIADALATVKWTVKVNGGYIVTFAGLEYKDGETFMMRPNIIPEHLYFTVNAPDDKFVWGPVIDTWRNTVTFEVRDKATALETGLYQLVLKNSDDITKANNLIAKFSENVNTSSHYVYLAPSVYRIDGAQFKFTGVPTYGGEAATYIYIKKNSDTNVDILSAGGAEIKNVACSFANGEITFSGYGIKNYTQTDNQGSIKYEPKEMPSLVSGTGPTTYALTPISLTAYDSYYIKYTGDYTNSDRFDYKKSSPTGISNYGKEELFIVNKGTTFAADDFVFDGVKCTNVEIVRQPTATDPGELRLTLAAETEEYSVRLIGEAAKAEDRVVYHEKEYADGTVVNVPVTAAPTALDFKTNVSDRFVWGPVFDHEAKTVTFEIKTPVDVTAQSGTPLTTNGWYQFMLVPHSNGETFINDINSHCTATKSRAGSYIYMFNADQEFLQGSSSYYPAKFAAVPTDGDQAKSFFYVTTNGSNREKPQLTTISGRNIGANGHVGSDGVRRMEAINDKNIYGIYRWFRYDTGSEEAPYMGASGEGRNFFVRAVKVDPTTMYKVYKVDLTDTSHNTVKFIGDGNHGISEVFNNGYFFLDKDSAEPTKEQFKFAGQTIINSITITPGDGVKTITFNVTSPASLYSNTIIHRQHDVYDRLEATSADMMPGSNYIKKGEGMLDHPHAGSGYNDNDKRIQNTSVFNITQYTKPGTRTECVLPFTKAKSTSGHLEEYQRWYDYTTERPLSSEILTLDNGNSTLGNFYAFANGHCNYNQTGRQYNVLGKADIKLPVGSEEIYVAVDASEFQDWQRLANGNILEPSLNERVIYHIISAHKMAEKLQVYNAAKPVDTWWEDKLFYVPNIKRGSDTYRNNADLIPLDMPFTNYWIYKTTGDTSNDNLMPIVAENGNYTTLRNNIEIVIEGTATDKRPMTDYLEVGVFDGNPGSIGNAAYINSNHFFYYKVKGTGTTRVIPDGSQAVIKIYAKNGASATTKYQLAKFTLNFQSDSEPLAISNVIGNAASTRSVDYFLAKKFKQVASMTFSEKENSFTYIPNRRKDNNESRTYAYPIDFSRTSYGYSPSYTFGNYSVTKQGWGIKFYPVALYERNIKNPSSTSMAITDDYFFYIDAAESPGQVASVPLEGTLCAGTRLYCYGWLGSGNAYNGGSNPTGASVVIQLVGRRNNGTEEVLASYLSGTLTDVSYDSNGNEMRSLSYGRTPSMEKALYMEPAGTQVGVWNSIGFSFLVSKSGFDSYEMRIINNCFSTAGGDYSLDDFRVFANPPKGDVDFTTPLCSDKVRHAKVYADYDMLRDMSTTNDQNTSGGIATTYCFIDAEIFDNYSEGEYLIKDMFEIDETGNHNLKAEYNPTTTPAVADVINHAFRKALVGSRYVKDEENHPERTDYGFHTYVIDSDYETIQEYAYNDSKNGVIYREQKGDGIRRVVFKEDVVRGEMQMVPAEPGKEDLHPAYWPNLRPSRTYYLVFSPMLVDQELINEEHTATSVFGIHESCSFFGKFTTKDPMHVILDNADIESDLPITAVCYDEKKEFHFDMPALKLDKPIVDEAYCISDESLNGKVVPSTQGANHYKYEASFNNDDVYGVIKNLPYDWWMGGTLGDTKYRGTIDEYLTATHPTRTYSGPQDIAHKQDQAPVNIAQAMTDFRFFYPDFGKSGGELDWTTVTRKDYNNDTGYGLLDSEIQTIKDFVDAKIILLHRNTYDMPLTYKEAEELQAKEINDMTEDEMSNRILQLALALNKDFEGDVDLPLKNLESTVLSMLESDESKKQLTLEEFNNFTREQLIEIAEKMHDLTDKYKMSDEVYNKICTMSDGDLRRAVEDVLDAMPDAYMLSFAATSFPNIGHEKRAYLVVRALNILSRETVADLMKVKPNATSDEIRAALRAKMIELFSQQQPVVLRKMWADTSAELTEAERIALLTEEGKNGEPATILNPATMDDAEKLAVLIEDALAKIVNNVIADMRSDRYIHFTLVPIMPSQENFVDEPYIFCPEPRGVKLRITNKKPQMFDGFADMPYPDDMDNVPVRIGLQQINAVPYDEETADAKTLRIPLRRLGRAQTDGERDQIEVNEHGYGRYLFLESTNDPAYKREGSTADPKTGLTKAALLAVANPEDDYPADEENEIGRHHLIGQALNLQAIYSDQDNFMDIQLNPNFKFREGYTYRVGFNFVESKSKTNAETGEVVYERNQSCFGTMLFDMKIVPEYQKWTGAVSNDWTNDANWQRADRSDLHADNLPTGEVITGATNYAKATAEDAEAAKRYPTNAANETLASFVPMAFTNTLIAEGASVMPQLYNVIPAHHPYKDSDDNVVEGAFVVLNTTTASDKAKYDMEVYDATGAWHKADNYECGLFGTYVAKGVTFEPATSLYNAHLLSYQKAWVEYSLNANRWYTIASPLQETFSGEWYSPTGSGADKGKQLTPHFYDINYNVALNNRFNPAYYQRSWDQGTANMFRCFDESHDSEGYYLPNEKPLNVAIGLDWSHVYNDVKVNYSNGGFSVKPAFDDDSEGQVLVRMPKADTSYLYFDEGDETDNATHRGDETSITRGAGHYRLISDKLATADSFTQSITNANGADNPYYLVANPFMAPMDMTEFFTANPQFEAGKFWIMTNSLQEVNMKTTDGWISTTGDGAEGAVAPLQAFFVKLATPTADAVTVTYNKAMQKTLDANATVPVLKAPARKSSSSLSSSSSMVFRIEATGADGVLQSQAAVAFSETADNAFRATEDAELLLDGNTADEVATVFTTAPTAEMGEAQAMQFNALSRTVTTIPLGVIAPTADTETTLTFSGISALAETMEEAPYLYDAASDSFTVLCEDTALTIEGNSTGRYFIVSGMHMPYDDGSDIDNGEPLKAYNLHGIRVATPQRGTVTIRGSRKEFNR